MKSENISHDTVKQQLSTWGTRTLWGTQGVSRGYAKFKIYSKLACTSSLFHLKIDKGFKYLKITPFIFLSLWKWYARDTNLIWGYAGVLKSDLGVREYQKVENPCRKAMPIVSPTTLNHI